MSNELSLSALAAVPEIAGFLRAIAEGRTKTGKDALWMAASELEKAAGISSFDNKN